VFRLSDGVRVLVDQAGQDGFFGGSLVCRCRSPWRGERQVRRRDALLYTLVRPGRIVVRLVVDQDGAQMLLAEDQHAVQKLAAQGADEPFAGRIHTWSLDRGAQDPGPGGLEDGVERRW
jgi:hypothetical protein